MMDALSEQIGMDPVEVRLKNIPSFSQARPGNPPYTSTGLKECLEQGAKAFGWATAVGPWNSRTLRRPDSTSHKGVPPRVSGGGSENRGAPG